MRTVILILCMVLLLTVSVFAESEMQEIYLQVPKEQLPKIINFLLDNGYQVLQEDGQEVWQYQRQAEIKDKTPFVPKQLLSTVMQKLGYLLLFLFGVLLLYRVGQWLLEVKNNWVESQEECDDCTIYLVQRIPRQQVYVNHSYGYSARHRQSPYFVFNDRGQYNLIRQQPMP